ncbi:cytochrome P450 [Streptomyces noursei]|uniref:cytochrome P450 n=1 Tax=Streptomyces noursei TaxID=1971 RepID=UPI003555FE19
MPGYEGPTPPADPGVFIGMDAPEHPRYRRLLTGKFTVRRMTQLTARIERVAAEHLDIMERHGGPIDLATTYAQPIPATVVLASSAANRDPARFTGPNTLDLRRNPVGHVGFGHGPHQCLGQQLARVEMRVALPALAARFPGLRLAGPAAGIPLRERATVYGVTTLPVAW